MASSLLTRLAKLEASLPEPVKRLRVLRVPVGRRVEEFLSEAAAALGWSTVPSTIGEASAMLDDAGWDAFRQWLITQVRTQCRMPPW